MRLSWTVPVLGLIGLLAFRTSRLITKVENTATDITQLSITHIRTSDISVLDSLLSGIIISIYVFYSSTLMFTSQKNPECTFQCIFR